MIKNYTSGVSPEVTVARIEKALAQSGVSAINKQYDPQGRIQALTFTIHVSNERPMTVRLPVKEEDMAKAMFNQYCKNKTRRYVRKGLTDFRDQASRTAWKVMQEWVEIQLTLITLNQADFTEVFMPYIWNGQQTVYEQLKGSRLRQLALHCPNPSEG